MGNISLLPVQVNNIYYIVGKVFLQGMFMLHNQTDGSVFFFQKHLRDSDIEAQLSALLCSSEDEEFDDEAVGYFVSDSYNIDFDQRLDEVQNLSTEALHSLLEGEPDLSLIQDTTTSQDVTMAEVHEEAICSIPEISVAASTSTSLPLPEVTVSDEQNTAQTTLSFSRDTFRPLQDKSRNWSFIHENGTWPSFDREMQVKKRYTNRAQPLEYFIDFFPEELIDIIVQNTNLYANYTHAKAWTDVTKQEMKAYFGLIILMSINPLADINTYWSTDEFFRNPVICKVMPSKRFKKISQNLHISNITTEAPRNSPDYDKLGKIKPAIDILNKTFKDNVQVSAFNSIDESMIRFKGRSHMKQYMPKKPIKRGYKCWARADSKTGYLYEFQFYSGKVDSGTEENLGARVILDLCESLPSNTLVAFDNFFTSLPLLEILFEKHIYSVGTVRINRKGLPDVLTGKNLNSGERKETVLKPGEFIYQCDGPITVIKWKDTKDVFVATTAFNPRAVEMIERKQKDGTKKKMFCYQSNCNTDSDTESFHESDWEEDNLMDIVTEEDKSSNDKI